MKLKLLGLEHRPSTGIPRGTRRKFIKHVWTHGHARNAPTGSENEKGVPRMKLAVVTTSLWAQSENWQPNTDNPGPILTVDDALWYLSWLERLTPKKNGKPAMRHNVVLKLTAKTTYAMLKAAKDAGFYLVKIYPDGVTTNSEGGWTSLRELYPAIEAAAKLDFIIMLHGEEPGKHIDTYARERRFMRKSFLQTVKDFPGVNFDVQHLSCWESVDMIGEMPACVTAGLTIHHCILSRNDVLEWQGPKRRGLNPDNHCRPPAQTFRDRNRVLHVALHANEPQYQKFHMGPDSAPWKKGDKYCNCGCAGVCSSPSAGPVVVELFDNNKRLDHPAFEAFTVRNGARRFNIVVDEEATYELEKADWTVPKQYGGVTPFWATRTTSWRPTDPVALNPRLLLS